MAKYTILFGEYMKEAGRTLPAEFSQIEGFSDLFVGHFCDREIGFETEELFNIKLQTRSTLVMPYYIKKIQLQTKYLGLLNTPIKTTYFEEDVTANLGEQNTSTTELPYDVQTAKPSTINKAEETTNTNHREGNNREEGTTDINAILNALNHNVSMILKDLLKEFDTLFMGVY